MKPKSLLYLKFDLEISINMHERFSINVCFLRSKKKALKETALNLNS